MNQRETQEGIPSSVDEAVKNSAVPGLGGGEEEPIRTASDSEGESHIAGESQENWDANPLAPVEEKMESAAEVAAIHETSELSLDEIAEVLESADATEAEKEANPHAAVSARNRGKKRWYIIQAYSGFEKKVAHAILTEAEQQGMRDQFEEVVVPTEEVVEVRKGKKVQSERKFFPGYVLAKMEMNDATWQLVKSTEKVTGFLGGKGMRPQPITEAEAQAIFQQVEEGVESPRRAVVFEIGEEVKIVDGPFDSFIGTVEGIDDEKEKLKVSVSIFGRATPVELEFGQVEKV